MLDMHSTVFKPLL